MQQPQGENIFLPGLSIMWWQPDPAAMQEVDMRLMQNMPNARVPDQWHEGLPLRFGPHSG
jgi:hypothetical protein